MSRTTNSRQLPDMDRTTPEPDVTPEASPADTPDDIQHSTPLEEAAPEKGVAAEHAVSSERDGAEEATAAEEGPEGEAPVAEKPVGEVPVEEGTTASEGESEEKPAVDADTDTASDKVSGAQEEAPAEEASAGEKETPSGEACAVEESTAAETDPADEGNTATDEDTSEGGGPAEPPDEPVAPGKWRDRHPVAARNVGWTVTGLSLLLVCFALLMPTSAPKFTPGVFLRIPVEAVLGAAVLIVLPRRPRLVVAILAGAILGVLTVLNLLDVGFNMFLGRGFNVVLDWVLFDDAQSYLKDTMGNGGAIGAVIAVVALVLIVLVLMTLAVLRVSNVMARNHDAASRATLVVGTAWVTCAALGLQLSGPGIAARTTVARVEDRVNRVQATLKDEAAFAKEAKKDAFGGTPGDQLLTDLRGKDVMIAFIESYGRSAIEDEATAAGVDATLTAKNEALTKAGYSAKSGWLTSATYGGSSWLGHSTFLSGLWINNQNRYRTVTAGEHLTLTGAFKRTGAWRTVGVMPGVQKNWPEGKFYGLDNVYDSRELGYEGPKFSWSTMPDQYALSAFERLEHGKKRDKPLMSEIILTSSHQPWAPIPKMIPWDQVGDGSVYEGIEKAGKDPADVFYDSKKVKEEYGKSIQYSVNSLIDYVVKYGSKNTVLVFLGDHQPLAGVSGSNAGRDVPVSIVARDKSVLDKIEDWGWTDGIKPDKSAPVWRMDSFRDRFLTAYGSTPKP
ncbi:sulfatase [Streptomyces sp. ActVer]|uniref:sulfatase n=1 Tax=Streptomyces sp. ActVer TaxID=3014558 RepID=UPI0022B5DD70|nr:sulfatase [Streptomyces sp. ActVer]MCZ4510282.1 sulfatase [Streptomyces sp. ActVer]